MRLKTWIVFLTTFSLIHSASAHANKKLGIRSLKRFTVIGGRTFPIANFTVFTFPKAKWNTAQTMDLIEEGLEQKWSCWLLG